MHSTKLRNERLRIPLLLAALVLSVTGCAAPSPVPPQAPTLPAKPLLTEPLPSETYSESVRASLQKWGERLTPTLQTSEPSKPHGPNTKLSTTD